MQVVAVRILCILLALVPGVVFAVDFPECDSEEIQFYWDHPEERLLEAIEFHVEEAKYNNKTYVGHADLGCFTEQYLYVDVELEKEQEARVRTLLELKASAVYASVVEEAKQAGSFLFQNYYENILCELHLLAYLPRNGDCSREAVPILKKLIKANEEAREKNKQSAFAALTKLKSEILRNIKSNWSRPSSFTPGLEVKLLIHVGRSGVVISADVVRGSGDRIFDVSSELAVEKASPLPFPAESRYYEFINKFELKFRPEEAKKEPTITTFKLTIESIPSGANLWIDGVSRGTTPKVVKVEKGYRKIKLRKEGYEDREQEVFVSADSSRSFTLDKKTKKPTSDLTQYSGRYRIEKNQFCSDCQRSYFSLNISPTKVTGYWDLVPGRLGYSVRVVTSRGGTSISLSLVKRGAVLGAPAKIRMDIQFSIETMTMVVYEGNKRHQIRGARIR